jgi:hypothetical protein
MSGYSQPFQPLSELIEMVKTKMAGTKVAGTKELTFLQNRLRSGKDVLKRGGAVTMSLSEMRYSFEADAKRIYEGVEGNVSRWTSAPPPSIESSELLVGLSKLGKRQWTSNSPLENSTGSKRDESYTRLLARQLIRYIYQENALLGMKRLDIQNLLTTFGHKVSLNYVSQQKAHPFLPHSIPKTAKTMEMMERVKTKYQIEEKLFWRR